VNREVNLPVVIGIIVVILAIVGVIYWRSWATGYVEEKPSTMTTAEREAKLMSMFGMKQGTQQAGTNPPVSQTPGTAGGR
jgi:hypothetical protein